MEIKHFSGTELITFIGDRNLVDLLGFFRLEYFANIEKNRNYIILFEENKIIGHITYLKNGKRQLLLSIAITKNNKGNGYSKLLLNEYFKLLSNLDKFEITEFSEEGELCLSHYIYSFAEENDKEIVFTEENDFI